MIPKVFRKFQNFERKNDRTNIINIIILNIINFSKVSKFENLGKDNRVNFSAISTYQFYTNNYTTCFHFHCPLTSTDSPLKITLAHLQCLRNIYIYIFYD